MTKKKIPMITLVLMIFTGAFIGSFPVHIAFDPSTNILLGIYPKSSQVAHEPIVIDGNVALEAFVLGMGRMAYLGIMPFKSQI